ncbi:MAG TPA: PAS domain S-box protein, partial [Terriglobia bacterium]|nr:PAS domain S-box protein [Terriglobia bacterium]
HSHALLTELEGANSGLQQAESGTRGYVATGQDEYERMHDAGVSDAQEHLRSLRALTADNPKQQQALNVLMAQTASKIEVMQRLVDLRRDSGFAAAQELLRQGEGFRLMNQLSTSIESMKAEETRLLALREAAGRLGTQRANATIVAGTLLALGFVLAAIWIVRRDVIERQRAEEALHASKRRLDLAQKAGRIGTWDWLVPSGEVVWTPELEALYGLPPGAFGGKLESWKQAVHPGDAERTEKALLEAVASHRDFNTEFRIVWPDQSIRWVAARGVALYNDAGRPERVVGINMDITERKVAEESLRRSSAYNRSLIEASLDPLVTITPDGKISDVNAATEKATGHTRQELIGTDFSDSFTDPEKARAGYQQVFREGWVQDYELEIRHTDGHSTPVFYNASVYRDEAGQVIGVFAAARDITERRRAEQEVLRNTARLGEQAALLDLSNDAILVHDLSSAITFWSQGAARQYGWRKEEALGQRAHKLLRTQFPMPLAEIEAEVMREGRWEGDLVHATRDGRPIIVASRWVLQKTDSGEPKAILEVATDITERKRGEEALRRAGVYNRSLIEASPDPLVTISPSGKITDVNRATETITGLATADLIGNDFSDYFTEPAKARAGYEQVFREGSVRDYELEVRGRDGQVTPVLYNASVYRDETGKVIGVFAAARDITERKRAEAEIKRLNQSLERRVADRTVELASANRELEAFAYSVSHDLRAPLRHMDGFLTLLVKSGYDRLDETGRRYLDKVSTASRTMAGLIDDLLQFSRMGRKEIHKTVVSLGQLVEQVRHELESEGSGRVVNWEVGPLPEVTGDAAMLRLVLGNLLGNALKFTSPRPQARIEIGSRSSEAGEDVIWVRDNGAGFDMRYVAKLFNVFQRLHPASEFEGTGIGLANVRRIIERHGGRVWAEGVIGAGATFYFSLPRIPNQETLKHESEQRQKCEAHLVS